VTIYEVLKRDHKKVKDLLDKIEKTEERGQQRRAALFDELKSNLLAHSKAEDAILYERLKGSDDDEARKISLEAHEEHHVVEQLLNEMSELDAEDEVFMAKFKVLKEAVEHHVKEEEGEMFEQARQVLDREEARSMAERMLDAEARLLEGEEMSAEETAPRARAAVRARGGTR